MGIITNSQYDQLPVRLICVNNCGVFLLFKEVRSSFSGLRVEVLKLQSRIEEGFSKDNRERKHRRFLAEDGNRKLNFSLFGAFSPGGGKGGYSL